jgi:murein peptide amidase A
MIPAMSVAFDWADFQTAFSEAALAAGFIPTRLAEISPDHLTMWERPGDGPRVYLSAGIHGDEPAGPLALLELLREGFFSEAIHWMLGPALNPTGLAAVTRENARGIDLNRDYWLRETPEVIAHTAWLDSRPTPDLFVSLHEDWETSGFYFYEINLGTEDLDRTRSILAAVEPWFQPEPGPIIDGHDVSGPGWIYHTAEPDLPEGWPEAIYLAKMGCPLSFTFETPSRAGLHQRVAAHTAAVKAACAGL